MSTYKFTKDSKTGSLTLKSQKYRVSVLKAKGHVYTIISGPGFRLRGLTAIHDRVNDFELRVIALHFSKKARDFGKSMPKVQYVNYAEIFGSCFQ